MSAAPAEQAQGTPDYLVVGHVAADRMGEQRVVLGGTATYAALTAHNLGAHVGVHTSASYEPGLVDTLYGVMVARVPAEYTTCFVNQYEEGGGRKQLIESTAERLTFEQILPEWRHAPVVHLGPLCQEMDAALVERFPRSLVCVTPQGWMRQWGDDGVVQAAPWADAERVLSRADAVVISQEDVASPLVIQEWASVARLLVVTLASRGCDVYKQGEPVFHSPAFTPAREADPTGAGDVFASAYFWHLRQSGDWRQAADWANCVASFAVEKRGVQAVPKLEDVETRWKRNTRLQQPSGT